MTRRAVGVLVIAALAAFPLHAQFGRRGRGDFEGRVMPNVPYDGRFTFARIRYDRWYTDQHITNEGPGWMHDYPWAEQNLMAIMKEVTILRPYMDGGNIFRLDDPNLMKYPVAYLSEPGWWELSESEITGLRNYLSKGGFLIIDDFQNNALYNWARMETDFRRALPELVWRRIEPTHPVFDTFFGIVEPEKVLQDPIQFYGLFEDNDPAKRLLVVTNFMADLGENWQFSGQGFYPIDVTNEAYKLGVNYLIYGLTR